MRLTKLFLLNCLLALFIFIPGMASAEEIPSHNNQQVLPLTPKEINKLQHLLKPSIGREFNSEAVHEHVIWNQTPINVVLPVNTERMVTFPTSIQFGYDKTVLDDDALKVQNNNGVLYLLAKKPFQTQRVQVKLNDSGKIVLLNLSASKTASHTPLDVVIAKSEPSLTESANKATHENNSNIPAQPSYVALTRFAAQQLYAPKRLLTQPNNIFRTPMRTQKTVPLFLDGSVMAMPLASWRGGDLFVTAVLLRNLLKQPLTPDPRNLNGKWVTATFFPLNELAIRGNTNDSTTVFLVSHRPFNDSFN